jgi:RNA polymerase sigma-70 factor (ECF subfamily)
VDRASERALDEYLVLLSQSGSVEALDGLARRWTPRLLRYAARLLAGSDNSADAARDVVQETWVGAISGLRRLRDPVQFPAWIYGIATRRCADVFRAQARRRRLDTGQVVGEVGHAGETPLEQQIDLVHAIRDLPPIHRAAIHLFYLEDLSVEEIAAVLEIPAGTVKSRLHHARGVLRRQLGAVATDHRHAAPRTRGIS